MKKYPVVITIPHAVCRRDSSGKNHDCDLVAVDAAYHLATAFGSKAITFIGDVNRRELDLNRYRSRQSPFRTELRRYFKRRLILLDVHSFAPKTTMKYDHADVAIGTNKKVGYEWYIEELADYLFTRGIKTFGVNGLTTDIVTEAKYQGVYGYLLEFNESQSTKKRKKIAKMIADYFFERAL